MMRNYVSLALAMTVALVMLQAHGLCQMNILVWSGFSSGFGAGRTPEAIVVSSVGQPFAGLSSQGNAVIRSGFLSIPFQGGLTLAVKELPTLPLTYSLGQNYPNPFNPTTTIRYELPMRSHVTLTVYDMLGREVGLLVNGDIGPGLHNVQFEGANLASGVYFYRIVATPVSGLGPPPTSGPGGGAFVSVKSSVLLK